MMAALAVVGVHEGKLLLRATSSSGSGECRAQQSAPNCARQGNAFVPLVRRANSGLRFSCAAICDGAQCHAAKGGREHDFASASSLFSVGRHVDAISSSSEVSHGRRARGSCVTVRAETKPRNLGQEGGKWLSSTTRHVRLYIGYIDPVTHVMDQQQLDKISLGLDPDDEFIWPEDKVQKVYKYFGELVEQYRGAEMTEYTLRLIGSDIEHYIRRLLLDGEIKYNLDCKVLNYSMGKPRFAPSAFNAEGELMIGD